MKANKKKYIGINLNEIVFSKIHKEANEQHRSLSSHIAFILENWLDAKSEQKEKGEKNEM